MASRRVLVIEDDPAIRRAVVDALSYDGYQPAQAGTFAEGKDAALRFPCDLVLLDLVLPGGDGLALLREVRLGKPTLPVIILTAKGEEADRVKGLRLGADDYVVKPFALEEVLARLRALERRAPEFRPTLITVADLRVDPATRSAERAGTAITLTTTEYALLEFLARHAGSVLGRAAISAHVWDENYDPFSNVIDVYVARLRRKVDRPGLVPLLHTVRGAGYTLDPDRGTA